MSMYIGTLWGYVSFIVVHIEEEPRIQPRIQAHYEPGYEIP